MIMLDIKMPKKCLACPASLYDSSNECYYCPATNFGGKKLNSDDLYKSRPEDCPLLDAEQEKQKLLDRINNRIEAYRGIAKGYEDNGNFEMYIAYCNIALGMERVLDLINQKEG